MELQKSTLTAGEVVLDENSLVKIAENEGEREENSTKVANTVKISGGEFQGASFGPQDQHQELHLTHQEGFQVTNLSAAHIGPKHITINHHHNTIVTKQDDAEKLIGGEEGDKQEQEWFQLSRAIRVFKDTPICEHADVYHGEISSEITGKRRLAVKLIKHNSKNEKEAKILLKLASHPNVVSILHADTYNAGPMKFMYIAMELCHEQNLQQHIEGSKAKGVPFDPVTMDSYAKQAIEGLRFIHEHGIIHQDLKLDNLLLSQDKKFLKICDFGLSKELKSGHSITKQSYVRVGTDGYRAPETYTSNIVSQQSDIFSLGLVIYALWSYGLHPFGDDPDDWNSNIKRGRGRDLGNILIYRKAEATNLLEGLLQFEPKKRPTAEQTLKHVYFLDNSSSMEVFGESSSGETVGPLRKSSGDGGDKKDDTILMFDFESSSTICFEPYTNFWGHMQRIDKPVPERLFSAVSHGDNVFVLTCYKEIFKLKFADQRSKWEMVGELAVDHGPRPRATVLNDNIFVIGGSSVSHTSTAITEEVEIFNIGDSQATSSTPLSAQRYDHCVVTVGDCIYCLGGKDESGKELSIVEKFDPASKQWGQETPMITARSNVNALEFHGSIYLLDANRLEIYNLQQKIWSSVFISSDIMERESLTPVVVSDKIYGVQSISARYRCIVFILDMDKKKWRNVSIKSAVSIYTGAIVPIRMGKQSEAVQSFGLRSDFTGWM